MISWFFSYVKIMFYTFYNWLKQIKMSLQNVAVHMENWRMRKLLDMNWFELNRIDYTVFAKEGLWGIVEDDVNQTQDAWDLIWTTTETSVKQLSRTQKTIYLTSDQVVGFPSLKPFVSKVSLLLQILRLDTRCI